jgi:rare lipoprotein A
MNYSDIAVMFKKGLLCIALAFLLFGCAQSGYSGHYKVGKAYKIKSVTYKPKEVRHYDKVGVASWYGPGFHGKKTANGEVFNKRDLTAAHQTLPLPSVVRVVNLTNNKSVIVRVTDRGPFMKKGETHRIIDLSERAAEILDMKRSGLAKVRVQFLPKTTEELYKRLKLRKT